MKSKVTLFFLLVLSLFVTGFLFKEYRLDAKYISDSNKLLKNARTIEKGIILNIPIYEDYRSDQIEGILRTHLLNDHLSVAHRLKLNPVKNTEEASELASKGDIVNIDTGVDASYFFYNVPKDLRYLRAFTKNGLEKLTQIFNKKFKSQVKDLPDSVTVKLAVSSALRPLKYQNNLTKRNENAVQESTHSYGISFDIFYDEYYVSGLSTEDEKKEKVFDINSLKKQMGLTLGAALRRQFQTILSETLIEMQKNGDLYAILEKNQRCYHITILP